MSNSPYDDFVATTEAYQREAEQFQADTIKTLEHLTALVLALRTALIDNDVISEDEFLLMARAAEQQIRETVE